MNKVAVAHAMSHSTTTADKYYRAYDDTTNVQGHQVIGKILEVPAGRKRQRFNQAQTDVIAKFFEADISNQTIPQAATLESFLASHRELFPHRKRGDIYSKIRNL